jgi:hypothetical protein
MRMTIDKLRDRVGETFTARGRGRRLTLTLMAVDALQAPPDAGRTPFSLESVPERRRERKRADGCRGRHERSFGHVGRLERLRDHRMGA